MNHVCEELVKFWLEQGSDYSVVNGLVRVAAEHAPAQFMHLLPSEIVSELRGISEVVPQSVDELFYVGSSIYKPSAFAGLSESETEARIERSGTESKEQMLRGLTALNRYFTSNPGEEHHREA